MAETTIEWADYTFNPWVGCQRVSPGCENCYAEAYDKRVGGVPKSQRALAAAQAGLPYPLEDEGAPLLRWGPKAPRWRTSAANWRLPGLWNRHAAAQGVRKRVFCASLADVFEDRPELARWRFDLFELIRATPNLDWLLLTKRPENIKRLWPNGEPLDPRATHGEARPVRPPLPPPSAQHWPNVWLGTTVEDQRRANERIPLLTVVPAAVHFLSCEPLLGPVRLPLCGYHVDWVIVGGESGGGARAFNVAWARAIRDDIAEAAPLKSLPVALFVKQLGANIRTRNDDFLTSGHEDDPPGWDIFDDSQIEENLSGYREDYQGAEVRIRLNAAAGGDMSEWPLDLRVRQFPEVRRG